jgi:hypothetical protein
MAVLLWMCSWGWNVQAHLDYIRYTGVGVGVPGIRATSYGPTKSLLRVRLQSGRRIWHMLLLKTPLIEGRLKKGDESNAEEPSSTVELRRETEQGSINTDGGTIHVVATAGFFTVSKSSERL